MSLERKKIKKIKNELKKTNFWKQYKKFFSSKKCFFILTKTSLIFNTNISDENLTNLERELALNIRDINQWKKNFKEASKYFVSPFNKCDWESFGMFMYYVWNHWQYWNKKEKNKIYNLDNFNELNDEKSKWYGNWINSMIATKNLDFNIYIRKVLKII